MLIISGATIAGAFDYRARVDFVKIPSVIKLRNGEYTSMERHIDLQETLKMRQSIIRHTAETFQPDIFIVDKEPHGAARRGRGDAVLPEDARHHAGAGPARGDGRPASARGRVGSKSDMMRKIGLFYDMIWVYGPPDFYDPLTGLDVPAAVRAKMKFVGFLQRSLSHERTAGPPARRATIFWSPPAAAATAPT